MLRCIYGYQKWIPDKILHRNDNPIFFSTFIFSLEKIILKENILFPKIFKIPLEKVKSKCKKKHTFQGFETIKKIYCYFKRIDERSNKDF